MPDAASPDLADQARVIAALRDPASFGPDCRAVRVLETHISWVFLTGRHAYKVKKAIALPFLDFRTLDARRRYCEQELALNRRTAALLYLDVVPVTGRDGRFAVGGDGTPVEWAVRMREFAQEALLSTMLARGELTPQHVDSLAETVARFHEGAERAAPDGPFGSPQEALTLALDNFTEMAALAEASSERSELDALRAWTLREHATCSAIMAERRARGFVRDCHGDLHLRNVALVDGEATPFDCIEFNERMRWGDVIGDIAFTVMDLQASGRADYARRLLNRYLEITGDYGGVPVLRFHLAYRAIVRAKIACMRAAQRGADAADGRERFHRHLRLAAQFMRAGRPALILMHGFAGCGKTTLSQALLEAVDAVRVRTDVERKRMHGHPAQARTGSGIATGLYAPDASRATYGHIAGLARSTVAAGYAVIVDGAFLARWQREVFSGLAAELRVPLVIVDLVARDSVLRHRVARRAALRNDASEADVAVLDHQLRTHDPLDDDERPFVVALDAEAALAQATVSANWRELVATLGDAAVRQRGDGQPQAREPGDPDGAAAARRRDAVR